MILPPASMWLRVAPHGRRGHRLWLPLFLLWLLLSPVVVVAFAVTGLIDVVLFVTARSYHHYTRLLFRTLALLADTRGMVVRVNADDSVVDLTIQ